MHIKNRILKLIGKKIHESEIWKIIKQACTFDHGKF